MDFDFEKIKRLEASYALPLYVFDEKGFIDNYKRLESAMQNAYSKYRISYSYKTNYTPYICKRVKSLGGYAEVVSGMEYSIAKRIGYDDAQIIFNGPDKGADGTAAFIGGAIINVDSLSELQSYCSIAKKNPSKTFKLGLRVNLDIGQNFISRFGMDEAEITQAFDMVREAANLRVAGLHCHISRCRGLDAWKNRTETMLRLADKFFDASPEYIDLGSGMFGSMEPSLAKQFDFVPSYEEYAEVTASLMAKHYRDEKGPILFTEPGTTLVNRFISLISRVGSVKEIRGKHFAILNCGVHNLGETCTLKQIPMQVVPAGNERTQYSDLDFVGYTCLEQDVMFSNYNGLLANGDYVVFGNVGGYSNVLKPPFIRPNCAMTANRIDGSFELIKEAETFDDILHTYVF